MERERNIIEHLVLTNDELIDIANYCGTYRKIVNEVVKYTGLTVTKRLDERFKIEELNYDSQIRVQYYLSIYEENKKIEKLKKLIKKRDEKKGKENEKK